MLNNLMFTLLTKIDTSVATSTAGDNPFKKMGTPIQGLISMALTPTLGIVGALGAIYCVILGARLAKADEPQEREKAKKSLTNAIVGFVLIFVLLAALKVGMPAFSNWYNNVG